MVLRESPAQKTPLGLSAGQTYLPVVELYVTWAEATAAEAAMTIAWKSMLTV